MGDSSEEDGPVLNLPGDVAERHARLVATIDDLVQRHGGTRAGLLPILQDVRAEFGEVGDVAVQVVADRLCLAPTEVQGVVTFYAFLQRRGRHEIRLCRSLSCALAGADDVAEAVEDALSIRAGATTSDGAVTLHRVNCIGQCDAAPAALVDDEPVGGLTADRARRIATRIRRADGPA